MDFRLDPRGDLPPSTIQPIYNQRRSNIPQIDPKNDMKRLSSFALGSRLRSKPCYDWVFSSASNIHVALDRSAFKEYTPFNSYVLTLSDHSQVQVKGIGKVELKIRRKPSGRDNHTIVLENVLHIPSWLCNIFSDVYFNPGNHFEHTWSDTGVQFSKREESGLRSWGYTETFCSLDRLVLAKQHKDSRSPMLEDKDREVFSVNLVWPTAQRARWKAFSARNQKDQLFRTCSESGTQIVGNSNRENVLVKKAGNNGAIARRATLSDMSGNIVKHMPSKRVSSLEAIVSDSTLLKGDNCP